MTNKGKPFLPGEYRPWNFSEFHPNIEKLEMHVEHFQGHIGTTGQEIIEKNYTENDMPPDLSCTAGCQHGGVDLHQYIQSLQYGDCKIVCVKARPAADN